MTILHALMSIFCAWAAWLSVGAGDASMSALYGFLCGGNLLRAIDLLVREPRCN